MKSWQAVLLGMALIAAGVIVYEVGQRMKAAGNVPTYSPGSYTPGSLQLATLPVLGPSAATLIDLIYGGNPPWLDQGSPTGGGGGW